VSTLYIYALIDPRTQKIRYVGKTTADIHERLKQHCGAWNGRTKKKAWLRELRSLGLKPKVKLLQKVNRRSFASWRAEDRWIERLVRRGEDLLNSAVVRRDKEYVFLCNVRNLLDLTEEEEADVARKASSHGVSVAAYLRKLLGLPPRRPGRPPKKPAAGNK
jgi:hypothetical protein